MYSHKVTRTRPCRCGKLHLAHCCKSPDLDRMYAPSLRGGIAGNSEDLLSTLLFSTFHAKNVIIPINDLPVLLRLLVQQVVHHAIMDWLNNVANELSLVLDGSLDTRLATPSLGAGPRSHLRLSTLCRCFSSLSPRGSSTMQIP